MPFVGKPIDPDAMLSRKVRLAADAPSPTSAPPTGAGEALGTVERFEARAARHRLADLCLMGSTRASYAGLLSRIRNHRLLYEEWGLARIDPGGRRTAVCFYGPPGTGKTMCAEALAGELGRPILEVDYAEIESKYVGETPKNIVAAFKAARDAGAVLFFDEADSILGRRMTNVTQAADQAVNVSRAVMLKQLDSFEGTVVFATNLAKNFDGAFVRRILMHVEVPAPDAAIRRSLWEKLVPRQLPGRDGLDWEGLVEASEGLVGGEIKNAILVAAATAADRDGPARIVTPADLASAIADVQRAKVEIGRYDFD